MIVGLLGITNYQLVCALEFVYKRRCDNLCDLQGGGLCCRYDGLAFKDRRGLDQQLWASH